jgi:hypothetical protein
MGRLRSPGGVCTPPKEGRVACNEHGCDLVGRHECAGRLLCNKHAKFWRLMHGFSHCARKYRRQVAKSGENHP